MHKILIVDDEKHILRLVEAFLKKSGFDVVTASGGEDALAILKSQEKIDLMILDKRMPGLSGFDVLKEIKASNVNVQVLLFSGELNLEEGHQKSLQEIGFSLDDVVSKPIQLSHLLEVVKKKLNLS